MTMISSDDDRFDMLPAPVIALQREISNHPELRKQLEDITELHEWYAQVATYAEVLVDGAFGPEELENLTKTLTKKLYELRTLHI